MILTGDWKGIEQPEHLRVVSYHALLLTFSSTTPLMCICKRIIQTCLLKSMFGWWYSSLQNTGRCKWTPWRSCKKAWRLETWTYPSQDQYRKLHGKWQEGYLPYEEFWLSGLYIQVEKIKRLEWNNVRRFHSCGQQRIKEENEADHNRLESTSQASHQTGRTAKDVYSCHLGLGQLLRAILQIWDLSGDSSNKQNNGAMVNAKMLKICTLWEENTWLAWQQYKADSMLFAQCHISVYS